jgi:hypothetical protein
MQLRSALPTNVHEIGVFQHRQVLGDRLPCEIHAVAFHKANANLEQRLVVSFRQLVQNYASGRISQSVKDRIEVPFVAEWHVPSFYATKWLHVKSASTAMLGLLLQLVCGPKTPEVYGAGVSGRLQAAVWFAVGV